MSQHEELLALHTLLMCPAECPPIQDGDTQTVRLLKGLIDNWHTLITTEEALRAENNALKREAWTWSKACEAEAGKVKEHRNAAMEADLRTQAAVRGEKQALAENETLKLANETNNRLLDERTAQLNKLDTTAAHWLQKAHEHQTENTALRGALERIAKYPRIRGDELGYEGCRHVARDALKTANAKSEGAEPLLAKLPLD